VYRKRFDIIITASDNQALVFSVLCSFFGKKRNLHILEELYINEPLKFIRKIRPFIYRLFFKHVDYIRTSSTREIENYSKILRIDSNRFWFLPYPSPVVNPVITITGEDYILSAGKQYRDYSTLIKAIRGTGYKIIIVSDRNSMKDVQLCDEVTVYYNISKEKYLDLLLKSKFVVVPLSNDFCSCGQFAFLEAMSYGKPAIVAKVTGSIDYIIDGKSGLFYKKGDFMDLREKIILLSTNNELGTKIAKEALLSIKNVFNQDVFVTSHFQFIEDKWQ
jgi:glycosyltransferase involved in cell wall biosynthesis